GIVGARHPSRAAANLPGVVVLRPGLVALLAARRDGVAPPQMLPGLGVPAVDEAADAKLGAGNAGDQYAVRYQRSDGERKAILPFSRLRLPQLLAILSVVGAHVSIGHGAEDFAVVERRHIVWSAC